MVGGVHTEADFEFPMARCYPLYTLHPEVLFVGDNVTSGRNLGAIFRGSLA